MELLSGSHPVDFRLGTDYPTAASRNVPRIDDPPRTEEEEEEAAGESRGGFDADFSPAPGPKYVCPICLLVFKDPMQTSCGHRFCRICLFHWLSQSSLCPSCKSSVTRDEVYPDNYAKREILGFTVSCPNRVNGCRAILELRAIDNHLRSCPGLVQLCELCSTTVANSEMEKHLRDSCLSVVIRCKFQQFGCPEQCERQQMGMHMLRNMPDHLEMLASHVLGSDRKVDSSITSILRNFALAEESNAPICDKLATGQKQNLDKIIWLKEPQYRHISSSLSAIAMAEEDDGVSKLTASLEKTVKEQAKKLDECSEYIKRLENTIQNLDTRSSQGVYIWKITDFNRRFQEAKMTSSSSILYSPGFYSSYYGYKTCLRVYLNGTGSAQGKYLSLFVHFVPGDFDDVLRWPFHGRIVLSILDQNSDCGLRSDICEDIKPSPSLEAFERPREVRNRKGFGYLEFVPLCTLLNSSYVKCDTLYIKAFVASYTL